MAFKFEQTSIEGLIVIEPHYIVDERGYFLKEFEKDEFEKHNLPINFYEVNESMSRKGTLRGLHFQSKYSQGKLIRVSQGAVYDVAVDLRNGSRTFGKWLGFHINAVNKRMLYIPEGFAHGFLALEDNTIFSYKCTNKYSPEHDSGIIWNDKTLNVEWPIKDIDVDLIITEKDKQLQTFIEFLEGRNDFGRQ